MEEQQEPEGNSGELQQDVFVENLVVDPSKTPDVQVLVGFLGRSSEAENWRLYLTPRLNIYLEFSAEDVLHTQSLSTAQSPLGGTIVWLRRDATVKYTRTGTLQAQAEFVQGDITSRFMAETDLQETALRGLADLVGRRLAATAGCYTFFSHCTLIWCPYPC